MLIVLRSTRNNKSLLTLKDKVAHSSRKDNILVNEATSGKRKETVKFGGGNTRILLENQNSQSI